MLELLPSGAHSRPQKGERTKIVTLVFKKTVPIHTVLSRRSHCGEPGLNPILSFMEFYYWRGRRMWILRKWWGVFTKPVCQEECVCVCVCVCVTKEMSGNPLCFFLKWPNPAQDGKARPCLTAEYLCPCDRSYFFFFRKKLSKFLSNPFKFWQQKLLILVSQKLLNNTAFTPK